jgi:hypothetical protein
MTSTGSQLDDSVLDFLGVNVYAHSIYGWGWSEAGEDHTGIVPVQMPGGFHFKLSEFFDWNGERRGGIGHIEELGHVYNDFWILFYGREIGHYNFTSILQHYNFHIGQYRPTLYPTAKDPRMAEAWPLPYFKDCRSVWGFGLIGSAKEIVEHSEAEKLKAWKARRDLS